MNNFKTTPFKRSVFVFIVTLIICLLALYLAGLIPQTPIYRNVQRSSDQFAEEDTYPSPINLSHYSYILDNFTDALILSHSYFMNTGETWLNILINPTYRDGQTPVSALLAVANDREIVANTTRNHYWMGFRIVVRPLLYFFSYAEIRAVVMWFFFGLLTGCILMLGRVCNYRVALAFAISVIAINPVIVSSSLQFSCCFLLAFAGILAISYFHQRDISYTIIFMMLGQLTQYFDFYTTPIITWGFPVLILLFIEQQNSRCKTVKEGLYLIGKTFLSWGAGYAAMWLIKALLVTCFTTKNGFAIFNSFLYYTGATSREGTMSYTAIDALLSCFKMLFPKPSKFVFLCIFIMWLITCTFWIKRYHIKISSIKLGQSFMYIIIGIIPVIWIICAKQASAIHFWFQYRGLGVFIFATLCFLLNILSHLHSHKSNNSSCLLNR